MATGPQSADPPPDANGEDESLQPFKGFLSPGICFASGHCVMVQNFSSTPTQIDAFDEVWIFTPDGERLMYVDPPAAGPDCQTYHDFDRTLGATITWNHAHEDRVSLALEGEDGTTLDLDVELGSTTETRLLNAISDLTPQSLLRTSIGQYVSTLLFNQLLDANGMKIAGVTDTQEPYRVEADSLRAVKNAAATLDEEDLGAVQPPDDLITFGDAKVPNEPFFSFGNLYLRPPPE